MENRPWIKVLGWTMLVLVLGAVSFSIPQNFDKSGIYHVRRIAKKLHIPVAPKRLTPAEKAEAFAEAAAWKLKFLKEFPALKATDHPVPAEVNGFLLLYQMGSSFRISMEFEQILNGQTPWDPEIAKRCLAEHADLAGKIEHIAALPTRSSANMPADYIGFINTSSGISCEILLLKAHLAAKAGDEAETLRLVSATANLGSHYHDIESPSILSEAFDISIDTKIKRAAFSTLLPALGKSADLVRWKSELGKKVHSSAEAAKVIRGEWQVGANFMEFPLLAVSEKRREMPDAEATLRCYSSILNQCVCELPSRSLADLMDYNFPSPDILSRLSIEGRSIIDLISSGRKSWIRGYARAAAVQQQYQAAMDLLILEKSGATLTSADAGRITHDPVSGSPFVFDAASRQLSAPADTSTLEVKPLALPW
jgi:hypothetical protein